MYPKHAHVEMENALDLGHALLEVLLIGLLRRFQDRLSLVIVLNRDLSVSDQKRQMKKVFYRLGKRLGVDEEFEKINGLDL